MHLLQSNVDLSMIRSWLGHASIETTNAYVEIDLEMKRKTLQCARNYFPRGKARSVLERNRDILPGFLGSSYVKKRPGKCDQTGFGEAQNHCAAHKCVRAHITTITSGDPTRSREDLDITRACAESATWWNPGPRAVVIGRGGT